MKKIFGVALAVTALVLGETRAVACGGGIEAEESLCDAEWLDNPFPQLGSSFRFALWTLASAYMPSHGVTPAPLRSNNMPPDEGPAYDEFSKKVTQLAASSGKAAPSIARRYRYVFGSDPCQTNSYASAIQFVDTLASSSIAKLQALELALLRERVLGVCGGDQKIQGEIVKQISSFPGSGAASDWAGYLGAISKFYLNKYDESIQDFGRLSQSSVPWIAEASTYMVARAKLVGSQVSWDGYSDPDEKNIDRKQLLGAASSFQEYLKKYPKGQFAASAQGIQRRITFLRDPEELFLALSTQISELLKTRQSGQAEWTEKLRITVDEMIANGKAAQLRETHYSKIESAPLVVAALALTDETSDPVIAYMLKGIVANEAGYKQFSGLYPLAKAALHYRLKQFQQAESLLAKPVPADAPEEIVTALSFLRGQSLERLNKVEEARKIWSSLAPKYTKARVAWVASFADRGQLRELGSQGSGINERSWLLGVWATRASDEDLKVVLLNSGSSPVATTLARDLLFDRLLLKKKYGEFLSLYSQIKDKGNYPEVGTAARTLASQPDDAKALLNYGYFLYARAIRPQPPCMSGPFHSMTSEKKEKLDPPFVYWRRALDQVSKGKKSEDEAKLLYYLIQCFAPTNKSYNCTWYQVDKSENKGKEWFKRLHSKYPDSKWAKEAKSYY